MLDGELFLNEGMDGIDAILIARQQAGSETVFAAFGRAREPAERVDAAVWPAEILCWGVLRSRLLRHPVFIAWQAQ